MLRSARRLCLAEAHRQPTSPCAAAGQGSSLQGRSRVRPGSRGSSVWESAHGLWKGWRDGSERGLLILPQCLPVTTLSAHGVSSEHTPRVQAWLATSMGTVLGLAPVLGPAPCGGFGGRCGQGRLCCLGLDLSMGMGAAGQPHGLLRHWPEAHPVLYPVVTRASRQAGSGPAHGAVPDATWPCRGSCYACWDLSRANPLWCTRCLSTCPVSEAASRLQFLWAPAL